MSNVRFNTYPTPIQYYGEYNNNKVYIKRDDLTEPVLGGNKVRKLELFLAEAKKQEANYIVTYGAAQSNHCRLTVATANKLGFKTLLILAKSDAVNYNGNFLIYDLYDTEIVWTDTDKVPETIDHTLNKLREKGFQPYFIQGGGHGHLGTHAYKLAYDEIIQQEKKLESAFTHIFHASGTGTTQAGLVVGKLLKRKNTNIIGISVARNEKRGLEVIEESILSYLSQYEKKYLYNENVLCFIDNYVGEGYADIYPEITNTIKTVVKQSSILLDPVYTGKAFYGMLQYISENQIKGQSVLFIHTGGIPLLFNYAKTFQEE